MSKKDHVLVVFNPSAETDKAEKRRAPLEVLLKTYDINYDLIDTIEKGTVELVKNEVETGNYDVIAIVGGDGTFHETVNGIMLSGYNKDVTICTLGGGTGNDQAKTFGMQIKQKNLEKNIQTLAGNNDNPFDVGFISCTDENGNEKEQYFFDSASMCGDAIVLKERNIQKEFYRSMGRLGRITKGYPVYATSFAITALESLLRFRKVNHAGVNIDGQPYNFPKLRNIVINNTYIYAGMLTLSEQTRHNDGKLDVITAKSNWEWWLKYMMAFRWNPFKQPLQYKGFGFMNVAQGKNINVFFDEPVVSQVDGEEFIKSNEFYIKTIEHATKIRTPLIMF